LGSGIRKKPIPDPGSRVQLQKGTGSGSETLEKGDQQEKLGTNRTREQIFQTAQTTAIAQ